MGPPRPASLRTTTPRTTAAPSRATTPRPRLARRRPNHDPRGLPTFPPPLRRGALWRGRTRRAVEMPGHGQLVDRLRLPTTCPQPLDNPLSQYRAPKRQRTFLMCGRRGHFYCGLTPLIAALVLHRQVGGGGVAA